MSPAGITVTSTPPDDAGVAAQAATLADRLRLPLRAPDMDIALVVTPQRLELRVLRGEPELVRGRGVAPEFEKVDVTSGPGRSLQAPLLKAVGIRKGDPYRPRVLDATAGWGEDAWLLAAAGCEVMAVERQPVIAVLLEDAVARARRWAPQVAGRITVMHADAMQVLTGRSGATVPDVVHLDPMFPGHAGRKTIERKPMRVLRRLAGDDTDADALLWPALQAAARRVVVKRPSNAPPLAGRAPTASHQGKGVRYDVYATR